MKDNDACLNAIDRFITTIAYMPEAARTALVLTLAVTHGIDAFTTVGHFLVTGKKPKCGKSTIACDIPAMFAWNPWKVGKLTTEPALINKFADTSDRPTLICDDVGKVFGTDGNSGGTSKLYALLIDAYRNDATVSMSRTGTTRDVPAFTVAFMNGLHKAVPDDLRTRAIRTTAVMRPKSVQLRSALDPSVRAEAAALNKAFHVWCSSSKDAAGWFALNGLRKIHPKLVDREAQIWGGPFGFADAAGGDWPQRVMTAFVTLELDASDQPIVTPSQQLVLDVAGVIIAHGLFKTNVFTADLVRELRVLPECELYNSVSDEHLVGMLTDSLGPSKVIRGYTIAGQEVEGKGRHSQPILREASELRDRLFPKLPTTEPDETDLELSLTPIGG